MPIVYYTSAFVDALYQIDLLKFIVGDAVHKRICVGLTCLFIFYEIVCYDSWNYVFRVI